MKTALTELIEDVNSMAQGLNEDELLVYFNRRVKELLEAEKKQIMEAYNEGKWAIKCNSDESVEDYFNRTFKSDE